MSYAETLDSVMHGDFSDASEEKRSEAVRNVISVCSIASGAVGLQPVPMLDLAVMAPMQVAMVQAIGHIHGHPLSKRSVAEMLSTLGGSIMTQATMRTAARIVPGIGLVMSASMAYSLTWAMGETSDHYFRNGRGLSDAELSRTFEEAYRRKRREKTSASPNGPALKDRLKMLEEVFAMGLIDEQEYAQKKSDLIAEI